MAQKIVKEVVTELVWKLFRISSKAWRYESVAENLAKMIESAQPMIIEIFYSGVELSPHRQVQLRMLFETLENCRKVTDEVLRNRGRNMIRQHYNARKMENLEKKIFIFLTGGSLTHILADIHLLRAMADERLGRMDMLVDSVDENLSSMKFRGGGMMMDEAMMEMVTDGDFGNLGVGLELGKRKVKEMMFNPKVEDIRLFGITGISGSGKTTLAIELERDEEVQGHFGNRVLFLTVSQSPNIEALRARLWGFLTGYDAGFGATNPVSFGHTNLVILDDVWTRESLNQLTYKVPGTTTLVVSRSRLADPRTTYYVELLNESEATSLFCLSAFDQEFIPSGFSKYLVKQFVEESKGVPSFLKVVGAALKNRSEKFWKGALKRLSRDEPVNETHESRMFARMEAILEDLDSKTRECFMDLGAFTWPVCLLVPELKYSLSRSVLSSDSLLMAQIVVGEVSTELSKKLFLVSSKAWGYKSVAGNLATIIESAQPTIKEILYSGVELSPHRQVQLRMLFETLEKCRKVTEEVFRSRRWNMIRQHYNARKMENLEKKISILLKGPVLTHILADIHLLQAISERLGRMDMLVDSLDENLNSMKFRGGGMMMDEAMMEMVSDGDFGNLGVGLELGKRKVKEMMFNSKVEEIRLFGITGMSGSGKTTLAIELERDEEVQGHFGNRVLFLTLSQSPNIEGLRARLWGFLTGYDAGFGATNPVSFGHTNLVILDDVWTRESLNQLTYKVPGTTTLVVSRSRLADPRTTYYVELLNESEATSLFCLSAFDQEFIPSGFSKYLVKQVVEECKGLPLALKVVGASLKDRPEKYWQGAAKRLSRGEPVNETHESRMFSQMEVSLQYLDLKTRECFLDLGAFPEDKKIPIDVLLNMWVEVHDLEEEAAFDILFDLVDKNLLALVNDPRLGALYHSNHDIFVTQHDALRDLALHLSNHGEVNRRERLLMPKRELVLPREWERNNDEPYDAHIVSIHTGEMSEMDWFDMELPKAKVLILNFSSEKYVLPPFIAKMSELRALVIINNGVSHAYLHDFSIFTNLAKLQSLWLERVHVPKLSRNMASMESFHKMSLIFCKSNNSFDQTAFNMTRIFPNLSDLTIDHCDNLVELPLAIFGMTSLSSISITNCSRFAEMSKNLSNLKALELLRLYACPELKSLPSEMCELPNLKYLDISQCVSLSSLPEEIGNLKTLEKIDMRECRFSSIPSSAVSLTSLFHVICDEEKLFMWEEVQNSVVGLRVEAAENCSSLD